jgi:Zn-dependent peptidase ImmA (M78 family)
MTLRVDIEPPMLLWACERTGWDVADAEARFPKFAEWIADDPEARRKPTLKQLEKFAQAVHVPLGMLFLREPPEERLPIADFRTLDAHHTARPSPELLDTVYAMQRRQGWLHDFLVEEGADPVDFVGSARLSDSPDVVGGEMRRLLGLTDDWASHVRTWEAAVGELRRTIERQRVIAVINGVVGNDTHRPLDVEEFRGFALTGRMAPLVFVNGADAKSAQMFTLAHELAHVWLNAEGLSSLPNLLPGDRDVEVWCNRAAAEMLVPQTALRARWPSVRSLPEPFQALARVFKVSPLVAARRALDLGLIDRDRFLTFYREQMTLHRTRRRDGGGDFYTTQSARVGAYFAENVIRAALEGRLGFKEAYDLTGLRGEAFRELGSRLGISV